MKIEKLEGPLPKWRLVDGTSSVEFAPSRGALVTSFNADGTELLFLDEATFNDVSKNVRGGVPLLFPFAGKAPAGSTLPQHGFARRMAWDVTSAVADEATARVECRLIDTAETRAAWPHAFDARFAVSLYDGRLMLEWAFQNTGDSPMPLHFGIHPYFRVGEKSAVRVEGTTGPAYDNKAGADRVVEQVDFSNGEVDLHFASSSGGTTLQRGDGSRVRMSWTPQFDTLVVWTLPGQPFVCVEPWTARGAQPSKLLVAPGATEKLAIEFWLER
jgi:D-hexose-6-phosphate mutarotase